MIDQAAAPMHDLGRVLDRAADVGQRLVAEADAEHRQLGALQHVERDAEASRCSRQPGPRDVVDRQRREEFVHDSSSLRTTTVTSPRQVKRLNVNES